MAYKKKTDYLSDEVETAQDSKPVKRKRGSKPASLELNCKATQSQLSEIISDCSHWFGRPLVESDEECYERVVEFFDYYANTGGIPTYEKLCLCLGVKHRQRLWEWEQGAKGGGRADIIKDAKLVLAAIDADLSLRGLIRDVVYIFRAKNFYGMKNECEVTVAHSVRIEDNMTREELLRRLLEDNSSTITDAPTIEATGEVKE